MDTDNDTLVLTLLGFAKYNPRNDRRSHTWLRIQQSMPTSPKLFGLTAEEKWAWLCVLCHANSLEDPEAELTLQLPWFCHHTGVAREVVLSMAHKLNGKTLELKHGATGCHQVVADGRQVVAPGNQTVPSGRQVVADGRPTDVRTDVRTGGGNPPPHQQQPTKILPELSTPTGNKLLAKCSLDLQRSLVEKYGADRVRDTAVSAQIWLAANPNRAKKNCGRFFSNWLARDTKAETQPAPSTQQASRGCLTPETVLDFE